MTLIGKIGLVGLAYTGARMLGKLSGATLGAVISRAPGVVRRFIGFSLFPQVGVAIAMALAVKTRFDVPEFGPSGKELSDPVINILLFTTLITEVVGPLVTKATLTAAGEVHKGDWSMYFYVLQLFDPDYREDILLALTSAGITHATVVEGTNYDKLLEQQFPLFIGFFRSPDDRQRFSLLIFGMVEDEDTIDGVVEVLHQAGIDNRKTDIYRIILLSGERKG